MTPHFRAVTDLRRILAIVWTASGGLLVLWAALLMVQGVLPVAMVFLTKPLVDGLQRAVGHGVAWEVLRPVVLLAVAMGALMALSEAIRLALQWVSAAQAELVQDHIADLVHAKSAALDLSYFESAEFFDRLFRVRFDAASRPLALLESSGNLVQNGITLVGMAAVLLSYGGWLPLALLAGTLPALLVVLRNGRRYHAWWNDSTTDRRRSQYYGDLLTGADHAAELRLFGLGDHFRTGYLFLRRRLRSDRLRLLREQGVGKGAAELVALAVAAGTIGWMIWRALLGLATLGDIALFYQAFQRGQGLVKGLLADIGQIYSNRLFLENLFEFLALQPRIVAPAPAEERAVPAVLKDGIRFSGVTFRYPGADRAALDRFDLTIPAGKTVAIVGANGAGKSTLLKLLCRFYDPDEGRVELDGIDTRRFDPSALRRMITVMFQVPVNYQATVRENITMGARRADGVDGAMTEGDRRRMEGAAREAGAEEFVRALPQRYESLLGRLFPGGTELSGGEWQRIALARAYYRPSSLIILDEPTSMMDSWAEAEWFEHFRSLAARTTSVIITHRLSIARKADVIHVMEHGRVVESGSHEELLALEGRYAASWRSVTRPAK